MSPLGKGHLANDFPNPWNGGFDAKARDVIGQLVPADLSYRDPDCNSVQGNNAAPLHLEPEEADELLDQAAPAVQSPSQASPDGGFSAAAWKAQQVVPPQNLGGSSQSTPTLAFGGPMVTVTPDLERRLQVS